MHQVLQVLVVGVGVHGGHQALVDPERVVQHLHHGHEAVGGARGAGDDAVLGRVEGVVVDPDDTGGVDVGGGGGDDHPLGPGVEVGRRLGTVGEDAGGLHDHLHAQVRPGQGLGLALGQKPHVLAVHLDAVVGDLDRAPQLAVGGVVAQEVSEGRGRTEVVDGDHLHPRARLEHGAVEVPADPPEPVYADSHRH